MILGTVSTGSGSDLVNDADQVVRKYHMLIIDQVATAPCTDCIRAQVRTFAAKHATADHFVALVLNAFRKTSGAT